MTCIVACLITCVLLRCSQTTMDQGCPKDRAGDAAGKGGRTRPTPAPPFCSCDRCDARDTFQRASLSWLFLAWSCHMRRHAVTPVARLVGALGVPLRSALPGSSNRVKRPYFSRHLFAGLTLAEWRRRVLLRRRRGDTPSSPNSPTVMRVGAVSNLPTGRRRILIRWEFC